MRAECLLPPTTPPIAKMLSSITRSMKLLALLAVVTACLSSVGVMAQSNDTPDVNVQTVFPNNPFSRAANGQANRVVFTITQPKGESFRLLTLESITGAFLNRDKVGKKGYVMRNMTTTKYKSLPIKVNDGKPLQVPFDFYPEFKPQQVGIEFRLLVNDEQTSKKHSIAAYTGSVTIYEPPKSWFDIQMLSLYVLLATLFGTTVYWASKHYPGSKSVDKRKQRKSNVQATTGSSSSKDGLSTRGQPLSSTVGTLPAKGTSSSTAYDEDWIPKHHLKQSASGTNSPRPRAGRTASGRG